MRRLMLLVTLVSLACAGEERPQASARELITIRTLGNAYLEENRLDSAEVEFLKLTELAPDESLGFANLGLVYLRQGRYAEAEAAIQQARDLDPNQAEIRLMLAKLFELTDRMDLAEAELNGAVAIDTTNIKALYALAELSDQSDAPDARQRRTAYLARIVRVAPANVAARLKLMEALLREGLADSAAVQLEEVRRQVPELPPQSTDFLDEALRSARAGDANAAGTPAAMFHNVLRVTPVYQAGLDDVRGPAGALIGFPLVTFSQDLTMAVLDPQDVLAALSFSDITELVGLDTINASGPSEALAVGDYDSDGDQDFYLVVNGVGHLFQNQGVTFSEVADEAGVRDVAGAHASIFADYDNDGRLDLHVLGSAGAYLFHNDGGGAFRDRARNAGLGGISGGRQVFVDADHDGDLDLFQVGDGSNALYRNNLDGTFAELATQWGLGGTRASRAVGFADFDGDDAIDLVVANADGNTQLFGNLRGGRFEDRSEQSGLAGETAAIALAVADYDNDGFFDLALGTDGTSRYALFRNRGDGTFERDARPTAMLDALDGFAAADMRFFDFDNDGWLDIVVVGTGRDGTGLRLFRNAAPGRFDDVTSLLQSDIGPSSHVVIADYGEDRDLDLFVATNAGELRLLRNDGGNANHSFKVELQALAAGSGKQNHFGIGAKLELRAGQLYQARVVTEPVTYFGLGSRLKADVLRILWTNGVPQNSFWPGGDRDLIEEQILKGSCLFLYIWNEQEFVFLKDVMWKSALGMPVGIMGDGDRAYAPAGASREYIRIPGEMLVERDGKYVMQLTEELWEVAYMDEVKLLVVDHPAAVDVFVNERFVPPAPTPLVLHHIRDRRMPIAAVDDRGTDVLSMIRAKDDNFVSTMTPAAHQGVTEMHDLILDFGDLGDADVIQLYLQGWIFPSDASINVARSQSEALRTVGPSLAVVGEDGDWHTVIDDLGFPSGKDKTVIADLTGMFVTSDYRIRIRTNMEIYWDHAFIADVGDEPVRLTKLAPGSGELHYRGFSRTFRKGGRFGPHWFDYQTVTSESPWQTIEGAFTRYGDVTDLLIDADDRYVIMAPGDEVTVSFDAAAVPDLPEGWARDFLIYTDGWIKDADLNTATGNAVEPLPFHDMTSYPYADGEWYPDSPAATDFIREFNTRVVTRR